MSGNKKPQTFRNCIICGKMFRPLNRLSLKCCSKECGYKLRSITGTKKKGRHYPHLQRADVRQCKLCGQEFRATTDTYRKRQVYCSKQCWSKRATIYRKCLYCEAQIKTTKSVAKRYCNFECRNKGMVGSKRSEAVRLKMSEAIKNNLPATAFKRGKLHPDYKDGTGYEPYSYEFIRIREQVRARDNWTCQDCGAPQEEFIRALATHHIDGNKKNNDLHNLVILCPNCHLVRHRKGSQVIIDRWAKLTGKDPIRLKDNKKWSEIKND